MQRNRSANRPIRNRIIKQLGFTRRPFDELLTPGLRRQPISTTAIGFTADLVQASLTEADARKLGPRPKRD